MPRREIIDASGETLDRICGRLEVFQARRGYRFGVETLLLAGFASPGAARLCDLGCGSGVIAMVQVHFGRAARALGVEIQPALAERARRSVAHNGLAGRIAILEADLRQAHPELPPAGFDAVLANPPYGRAGCGHVNPDGEKARARHELSVTLAEVVAAAGRLCAVGGRFAAVVPPARLAELLAAAEHRGLRPARLRLVHGRAELPARHCLLECVRGGRADLEVEPPLLVYTPAGDYTPEVQAMLYPNVSLDRTSANEGVENE